MLSQLTTFVWWLDTFKRLVYSPRSYIYEGKRLSNDGREGAANTFQAFHLDGILAKHNTLHVFGGLNTLDPVIDVYSTTNNGQNILNLRTDNVNNINGHVISYPLEGDTTITVERNTGSETNPT